MARLETPNAVPEVFYFEIEQKSMSSNLRKLLLLLLGNTCRKVCFDAQSFILLALDIIRPEDKRVCYDWSLLDPLIGGWLLDPDKGSILFQQLCTFLSIEKQRENDRKPLGLELCCWLLEKQSESMAKLRHRLVQNALWDLYIHLETKITPMIAVMESWSIAVDCQKLKSIGNILNKKMTLLEEKAYSSAGRKFQLNSAVQLRQVLYDELKLDSSHGIKIKQTPMLKAKSTAEPALRSLMTVHPLPKIVLEYRHLRKLKSTYVDGILSHVSSHSNISTLWEQCSAATGRIVSNNPNLQAIPKESIVTEQQSEGVELRGCFRAKEGWSLIGADFKQIELRIMAHLSDDQKLISAFNNSEDIFYSLSQMRLRTGDVSRTERDKTKQLVYAYMYGAGAEKMSQLMGLDTCSAERLAEEFTNMFPSLVKFKRDVLVKCRREGWLATLSGRRRLFPNINSDDFKARNYSERQAVNFIIQGSAADICKWSMVRAEEKLRKSGLGEARLIMQIHDELIWEAPQQIAQSVVDMVKEAMESSSDYWGKKAQLRVNLPVSITVGTDWAQINNK